LSYKDPEKKRQWSKSKYDNDHEYKARIKKQSAARHKRLYNVDLEYTEKSRAKNNRRMKSLYDPIKNRETHLKNKFGMSSEYYDLMLSEQGGVCYICKEPPLGKRLAVETCHSTNQVRHLLCSDCNSALGLVKEDMNIIQSMAAYVREHNVGALGLN
jgi:Recombination endonuclease VII